MIPSLAKLLQALMTMLLQRVFAPPEETGATLSPPAIDAAIDVLKPLENVSLVEGLAPTVPLTHELSPPTTTETGTIAGGLTLTAATTLVPVSKPTLAPVSTPTAAPSAKASLRSVTNSAPIPTSCRTPKFVGDWQPFNDYPVPIAEAQGAIIGDDLVIISGFTGGYDNATNKCHALDLKDPKASWRPLADVPIEEGVTHAAFALVGSKFYMCGGYLGGHPGPHIDTCLVYDHSEDTWSSFAPLPEGRAGGGMVYSAEADALIFAAGAERPQAGVPDAVDYQHTWMYSFQNPGWVVKEDIPYLTNHMSYATVRDNKGKEHQFFLAGQVGENEYTGNVDSNFEWDVATESWTQRARLPFTRGHASSSTNAVNCGLLIAGGSTNEAGKTTDVSFYSAVSDSWTSIGDLPYAINTPVCVVDSDEGWYYCVTGWADGPFSAKIKIEL